MRIGLYKFSDCPAIDIVPVVLYCLSCRCMPLLFICCLPDPFACYLHRIGLDHAGLLSACLYVCLFFLSVCLSVCLCLSDCLPVCLCLSFCLSVGLSALSVCLPVFLCFCLSPVHLYVCVCLSACLSVGLSVCLPICLVCSSGCLPCLPACLSHRRTQQTGQSTASRTHWSCSSSTPCMAVCGARLTR